MRLVVALGVLLVSRCASFAAPVEVSKTLCVAQSGRALLAMPPATREAFLQALQDAKWPILRVDFAWSVIEPQRGQLDFAAYDDLVAAARTHGLKILGVLGGGTPWAVPAGAADPEDTPPTDPADFARFAGAVAKHYKKPPPGQSQAIAAWEIWSEPNAASHWQPAPDAPAYAKLAALAARAIRKVDKRVGLSTGGLLANQDVAAFGTNWGFLPAFGRAKPFRPVRNRYTAIGFQPYSYFFSAGVAPESSANPLHLSLVGQIADLAARATAAKIFGKPWITELGWHTATDPGGGLPPGVSETTQAEYLVRAATLALSQGIERTCWYALVDGADPTHVAGDAFGLLRASDPPVVPKPAYAAAKVLAERLTGTVFFQDLREQLGLDASGYAMCFRTSSAKRTVVVFWSTGDTVPIVFSDIADGAKSVTLWPTDGSPPTTYPDRTRSVSLELNPSPVLLEIQE